MKCQMYLFDLLYQIKSIKTKKKICTNSGINGSVGMTPLKPEIISPHTVLNRNIESVHIKFFIHKKNKVTWYFMLTVPSKLLLTCFQP